MRRLGFGAAVAALVLAGAPAFASFVTGAPAGGNSFATATLQPPTSLTAEDACPSAAPEVRLRWVASTSTFATGYDVLRSEHGGGSTITPVEGGSVQDYVDAGVSAGQTYDYWVRATSQNWTSLWSEVATLTPAACP